MIVRHKQSQKQNTSHRNDYAWCRSYVFRLMSASWRSLHFFFWFSLDTFPLANNYTRKCRKHDEREKKREKYTATKKNIEAIKISHTKTNFRLQTWWTYLKHQIDFTKKNIKYKYIHKKHNAAKNNEKKNTTNRNSNDNEIHTIIENRNLGARIQLLKSYIRMQHPIHVRTRFNVTMMTVTTDAQNIGHNRIVWISTEKKATTFNWIQCLLFLWVFNKFLKIETWRACGTRSTIAITV